MPYCLELTTCSEFLKGGGVKWMGGNWGVNKMGASRPSIALKPLTVVLCGQGTGETF